MICSLPQLSCICSDSPVMPYGETCSCVVTAKWCATPRTAECRLLNNSLVEFSGEEHARILRFHRCFYDWLRKRYTSHQRDGSQVYPSHYSDLIFVYLFGARYGLPVRDVETASEEVMGTWLSRYSTWQAGRRRNNTEGFTLMQEGFRLALGCRNEDDENKDINRKWFKFCGTISDYKITDYNATQHCMHCKACYDLRTVTHWHCGRCRVCHVEVNKPCASCQGVSARYPKEEEPAENVGYQYCHSECDCSDCTKADGMDEIQSLS